MNVNVFFSLVCLPFLLSACSLFSLPFFFCSFFYSFLVFLCVYLFNGSCVVCLFFPSFIYSSICLYVSFLACLFVCHFVCSFVRLFIRLFIRCSFVYSVFFVCLSFLSYERSCVFLYFLFAFFSLVCLFAGSFLHLLLCSFARSFVFCLISEEHYLFVMEDPNKTESMSGWDKKQVVYLKL